MALLGESLVEEWLNRDGFFTIRGVKHGVGEMDLLAVRQVQNGQVTGWHVEVQISFRPIGFIAPLLKSSAHNRRSIRARTDQEVDKCARQWVEDKYRDPRKVRLRNQLWPGVTWEFHFIHAVTKYPRELDVIAKEGVIVHPFHEILSSLANRGVHSFSGSAGGDLAEIVSYYRSFDKP